MRDALMPSLACAVARAGDMEALQVLVELVRPAATLGTSPSCAMPQVVWGRMAFPWGLQSLPCPGWPG